jgi:hypothetical protein
MKKYFSLIALLLCIPFLTGALLVIQGLGDGSVSTSSIQDGAVTPDKLYSPETYSLYYDDFFSFDSANNHSGSSNWLVTVGTMDAIAGLNGLVKFEDAGVNMDISLNPTFTSLPFDSEKNPNFKIRLSQRAAIAGTRRIGFGSASLASDPANGIFLKFSNGGNLILVSRSGAVESTVDSAVAMADGVYHTARVIVSGVSSIAFYVDGSLKGTITTNIPTVAMGFGAGLAGSSAGAGINVDYIHIFQLR